MLVDNVQKRLMAQRRAVNEETAALVSSHATQVRFAAMGGSSLVRPEREKALSICEAHHPTLGIVLEERRGESLRSQKKGHFAFIKTAWPVVFPYGELTEREDAIAFDLFV